jgi:predicted house-cleaning noncanonical NTP pyrophosphatase (MazG superfamily)
MSKTLEDMTVEEIEEYLQHRKSQESASVLEAEFLAIKEKIDGIKSTLQEIVDDSNRYYDQNYGSDYHFDDLKDGLRELRNMIDDANLLGWSYSSRNC